MEKFMSGDIVRYGSGCTALAKLDLPHAGGWSAEQCMGGGVYISLHPHVRKADEDDLYMWKKQAWHRGEGIPPCWRPKIHKKDGKWTVSNKSPVPRRWLEQFNGLLCMAKVCAISLNLKERQP